VTSPDDRPDPEQLDQLRRGIEVPSLEDIEQNPGLEYLRDAPPSPEVVEIRLDHGLRLDARPEDRLQNRLQLAVTESVNPLIQALRDMGVSLARATRAFTSLQEAVPDGCLGHRHRWHYRRPGAKAKHRRQRGAPGVVLCLARGCPAIKVGGHVVGAAFCR
jgi:hypothetical protein